MASVQDLKTQIENVNALGRTNLAEKGVELSETATTYEIMSKIAEIVSGGGGVTYTSIVYNTDNTVTLTDKDGAVHTMSCTYENGKLIGVAYDGKAVDLTYNGDALVKVGKTAVDVANAPATSGSGSVVTNAITDLSVTTMTSVVKFADTVDFGALHIENAVITGVERMNDYTLKLTGDLSNCTDNTVKITTDKGVFFDENIVTENIVPYKAVRGNLEFHTAGEPVAYTVKSDGSTSRTYIKYNSESAIVMCRSNKIDGSTWNGPILISLTRDGARTTYCAPGSSDNFVYDKDGQTYWYNKGWHEGNSVIGAREGMIIADTPQIVSAMSKGRNMYSAILDYYYRYI